MSCAARYSVSCTWALCLACSRWFSVLWGCSRLSSYNSPRCTLDWCSSGCSMPLVNCCSPLACRWCHAGTSMKQTDLRWIPLRSLLPWLRPSRNCPCTISQTSHRIRSTSFYITRIPRCCSVCGPSRARPRVWRNIGTLAAGKGIQVIAPDRDCTGKLPGPDERRPSGFCPHAHTYRRCYHHHYHQSTGALECAELASSAGTETGCRGHPREPDDPGGGDYWHG